LEDQVSLLSPGCFGGHEIVNELIAWRAETAEIDLETSSKRYATWAAELNRKVAVPTEYLLPRIIVRYADSLPEIMQAHAEHCFAQNPAEADALSKMPFGHYFYLGGGKSTYDLQPDAEPYNRAWSLLRFQMINDVIDSLFADRRDTTSLIDFACHWGGFAIDMAWRGYGDVVAFDARAENIKRARALGSYLGVSNASFDILDAYEAATFYKRKFDIVYSLGLLYHITDPIRLIQLTYEMTGRCAVFDTLAHKEPFSGYIQAYPREQMAKRPGMGLQRIELHPTYRALIELLRFAGFKQLIEIVPEMPESYPGRGKDHYFLGLRRTIVAIK
jgi:hypothetical protein